MLENDLMMHYSTNNIILLIRFEGFRVSKNQILTVHVHTVEVN